MEKMFIEPDMSQWGVSEATMIPATRDKYKLYKSDGMGTNQMD